MFYDFQGAVALHNLINIYLKLNPLPTFDDLKATVCGPPVYHNCKPPMAYRGGTWMIHAPIQSQQWHILTLGVNFHLHGRGTI